MNLGENRCWVPLSKTVPDSRPKWAKSTSASDKQGGKTIPFRACGTYLNGLYRGTPRSPQNPVGVRDPHPWLLYWFWNIFRTLNQLSQNSWNSLRIRHSAVDWKLLNEKIIKGKECKIAQIFLDLFVIFFLLLPIK